jgi:hypothetical protein
MFRLYIGDVNHIEVLDWMNENIGPVLKTTRHEYEYYDAHHGEGWTLHTTDVSDVSLQYDTIIEIQFAKKNDAMLAKIRWGGSLS